MKEIKPTNPEIFKWFNDQGFQTEQGEQEYKMAFVIDMPKILESYYKWRIENYE